MDQEILFLALKLTILEAKKTHLIASSGKLFIRFFVDNVVVESKELNAVDPEPCWNQTFRFHCYCGAGAERGHSAVSISDLMQRYGIAFELRLRQRTWTSRLWARSKVVGRGHVSFQYLLSGRPDSWVVMQTSEGATEAAVLHLSVHEDSAGINQNSGVLQSFARQNDSLEARMRRLERGCYNRSYCICGR